MKRIVTREANPQFQVSTAALISEVCGGGTQGQQLTINDIRERIQIMDAADAGKDGFIEMEDKQHKKLCELLSNFKFALAHRNLLQIIDDIMQAETLTKDWQQTGG